MDDKLQRRNNLIKAQKQLIDMFDLWVANVKANDLAEAKKIKDLSMIVRKRVYELESEIKKESNIIKLLN